MTEQTVIVLPDTDDTTLCLRLTGVVNRDDFTNNFDRPVRDMAERNGTYNLFLDYAPGFQGWTEEAADLSFKCISAIGSSVRRAAYVNPPDSRLLLMKMLGPIIRGEVRYFETGEQAEALAWVKDPDQASLS